MPQIRKMTEADLDRIAEIAASAFTKPWSRQAFADALLMDNTCFLLAEEEGCILGYCGLYMAADEGEIINVAVESEYCGQGIGDLLLTALLEEGIRNGIEHFFLEVRVSNTAAIHLYEKHGFIRQGIRKDYYQETHEDAYCMCR